ncbi:helix-turn-helix domain-containing protein [Janibacter sp. GS2]|uniref:helix-turn-helix domain-containing protein n=1 Tax=Janibacter sp. GS2 TaxID=3442646 RepID=UPI003EB74E8B
MPNTGAAPPSEDRWTALVHRLHDDADSLVSQFVDRVALLPPYSQGRVPLDRVRDDAISSFDYLLRRIGDLPVPERLGEVGPSIGRDRARRQVPLEQLLTAVRLDFRILWAALREHAGARDLELLVEHVEEVWAVVEDYSTTIQVSFVQETAVLARERRRVRSALIGSLLSRLEPDPQDVTAVALALEVDADWLFLVAATRQPEDRSLRAAAEQLSASGRPTHLQDTGRHSVLITRWHGSERATADDALPHVTCAVAPVARGLAEVPRAAHIAQHVADVMGAEHAGPHGLPQMWSRLAGVRMAELAPGVSSVVLDPLHRLRPAERDRLVDTALDYAATGSVQQTAGNLYCHRNTVVNRLRRFAEVSGCDMTKPRQAALALAALEWSSLDGTTSG